MVTTQSRNGSRSSVAPAAPPAPPADRVTERAASFWAKHDKGQQNPLIPAEVRNAIVDSFANVLVHAVRQAETNYGLTWFCDIEVNQGHYGGDPAVIEHWAIAFAPNAVRDPMLSALRDECAHEPIAASIRQFKTKNGEFGFDFGAPYAEDAVPF